MTNCQENSWNCQKYSQNLSSCLQLCSSSQLVKFPIFQATTIHFYHEKMQCKRKRKIKVLNLTNDILVRRVTPLSKFRENPLYLAQAKRGFYTLRSLTYLVVFCLFYPFMGRREGVNGVCCSRKFRDSFHFKVEM